jgi:hypothetical protein
MPKVHVTALAFYIGAWDTTLVGGNYRDGPCATSASETVHR